MQRHALQRIGGVVTSALTIVALLPLVCLAAPAESRIAIVPRPARLAELTGQFDLTEDTLIIADAAAGTEAHKLSAMLAMGTGFDLPVISLRALRQLRRASPLCRPSPPDASQCVPWIRLQLSPRFRGLGPEGYRLTVRPGLVAIYAAETAGLYYAFQSLRQLLPDESESDTAWSIPAVKIVDHPRFAWRGAMLDSSRHFQPKEFVKKFLDVMALHKLNRLHWHLTDDQGWRLEIMKYPRLTEVGAWRAESPVRLLPTGGFLNFLVSGSGDGSLDGVPYGGFYTQADVHEIVAYATERHIEIVPEIDMPGHIQSAIAAYPELGNSSEPVPVATSYSIKPNILNVEEATFSFLEDVLVEVLDLFPGQFIHLGGDEVLPDQWRDSPRAQERIAALGLRDEEELRFYFIQRMAAFVTERGRRAIVWNDSYSPELPKEVAIMSWLGQMPGVVAAKAGHQVVMAPLSNTYFDHAQSLPLPAAEQAILDAAAGPSSGVVRAFVTDLAEAYGFDPLVGALTAEESGRVLGGQGQLWTEWLHDPADVERNAFPRLSALAEAVWTPRTDKDPADFQARLAPHLRRLDRLDVHYFGAPVNRPLATSQTSVELARSNVPVARRMNQPTDRP